MGRLKQTDKIEALRKKKDQLEAQLKAAEARQKEASRKVDARRKIIAGALALEHLDKNRESEFGKAMIRLLDEYVIGEPNRAMFPFLPAKPDSKPEPKAAKAKQKATEAAASGV